jgi:hypothetical protein
LAELLRDRIVIGHDIQKDLKVISMDLQSHILRVQGVALRPTPVAFYMTVRGTQKYSRYCIANTPVRAPTKALPPQNARISGMRVEVRIVACLQSPPIVLRVPYHHM